MSGFIQRRWQKHNDKLLRRELRTEQIEDEEARYGATNHAGPVDPDAQPRIPTISFFDSFGGFRIRTPAPATSDEHGELAGVEYDESLEAQRRDSTAE